jgi:sn1-specific diacylglycerol lipase
LQLLCAIFGLISLTAQSGVPCNSTFEESDLTRAFITVVVVSQLVDVTSLVCCCYLFSANKIDEDDRHQEPKDQSWALNTWENRCRRYTRHIQICSCNLFGGSNITEGFDEVAKVLTDFFHHDGFLDVVPSDVVAGIVLVRIEQRTVRRLVSVAEDDLRGGAGAKKTRFEITSSSTNPAFSSSNGYRDVDVDSAERGLAPQRSIIGEPGGDRGSSGGGSQYYQRSVAQSIDLHTLEAMSRMSVYALGIYTHLIVIYMRPCTGLCRICCGASANSCSNASVCCLSSAGDVKAQAGGRGVIEGDNWCGLNHTGLSIVTENLRNTELVYVSFKNDTVHKVYAVFLDHEKEQVVIAIRGTLSLEDCITDAICDPIPVRYLPYHIALLAVRPQTFYFIFLSSS